MVHHLRSMVGSHGISTYDKDGRWVRAVPLPFYGGLLDRMRDACLVLRGKAFAVWWPKPGELEDALSGRNDQG